MLTKQEAIGAIYSWDGTTVQKKDQEVPAEKRWAQVRREAVAAAKAASEETDSETDEIEP